MNIFQRFYRAIKISSDSGKLGGILLIAATVVSITITNSPLQEKYLSFWHQEIGFTFLSLYLELWINDLLMAFFFFLVGLEIKRELVEGELSSVKKAILPLFAALGGMLFPALIYAAFNFSSGHLNGWAIPTATDIAFSLGVLSLLGKRVPVSLKVFLTALAIIDDLGGIVIIALFYSGQIQLSYLLIAAVLVFILFLLNKMKADNFLFYLIPSVFLWYAVFLSGIHPTIAAVIAACFIPMNKAVKLEHALYKPVNYIILPIFALANTAIVLSFESIPALFSPLGYGIILGLLAGKTIGITLFTGLSVKTRLAALPANITMNHIIGVGILAGIGFTISLFFTGLSFSDPATANLSKLAIITGSLLSAVIGLFYLSSLLKKKV